MYSFSQALQRAATVHRHGIASRFMGRETTWAETSARVARIAGALRALGLAPGDRVAILAANSEVYFQLLFAIPWAGGVVVPVNTRLSPEEIALCLEDSGSRMLCVDEACAALLGDRTPAGLRVVQLGTRTDSPDRVALEAALDGCEPVADAGRGGADLAALYYTGGTTGRSRGVMLTHEGMIVNTLQWALEIGVGRDDMLLIVAPMFHLVGGLNSLAAAVLGAGVSVLPRFEVRLLLQAIASERVTKVAVVPTMLGAIVSHPDVGAFDLSSLRRISYGGSPISEALLRRTLAVLPHVRLYQVYGQTEGGPTISMLKPEHHCAEAGGRLASAGQPIAGVELRILDEDDREVACGQVGEICVRGLTVSPGYWNQPEETARVQRNGWLHTGDAGYCDEEGYVYIVDRVKDMIITGGENVYSLEVENVLYLHPAVAECAVFGIPDERWGERVHAVVRLREGCHADRDELMAHCRRHLAAYKCVRSLELRTEPMPLSGANKILKRVLRAPYWQRHRRPL